MNPREKREARRAAARLQSLGRISIAPRSDDERLRETVQEARNQDVYEAAAECRACSELRSSCGDPTALCPRHLTQAMGV
jgi:hypothetical protein